MLIKILMFINNVNKNIKQKINIQLELCQVL